MIARLDSYFAIAQAAFQRRLAYRMEAWGSLFGQAAIAVLYVSLWQAAYAGRADVGGVPLHAMVTYGILGAAIAGTFNWIAFLNAVGETLRTGDIAVHLLRPWRYPLQLFAQEAGNVAFNLLFVVAPTIVMAAAVYGVQLPPSAADALLALSLGACGLLILFLLSCLGALTAFWLLTVFSIEWTMRGLIYLFGGLMVPLWFFPEPLASIAARLPFSFVAYYPISAYLGRISGSHVAEALALGLGWVALLCGAVAWLWSRAVKRIVVQGG